MEQVQSMDEGKDRLELMGRGVKSLFIVYDADGTVCGEIIYHVKKMFFNGNCSACSITHGPKKEKPEFTQLKGELKGEFSVPVHNIHRDEMHVELRLAARSLPCVVAELEDGWYETVLTPEELDRANGSVAGLERLVRGKLTGKEDYNSYGFPHHDQMDGYYEDALVPSFNR